MRDRALFDLAIDSKLRGCDLVKVKIGDLVAGGRVRNRAMVIDRYASLAGDSLYPSGNAAEYQAK